MKKVLRYSGLVLLTSFVGVFWLFVILFVVGIPVPLPLTQEQRDEIATYAPDEGVSVFEGSVVWKIGENAQLGITETILVGRYNGQVSMNRYGKTYMFWDVAKTMRDRRRLEFRPAEPQVQTWEGDAGNGYRYQERVRTFGPTITWQSGPRDVTIEDKTWHDLGLPPVEPPPVPLDEVPAPPAK